MLTYLSNHKTHRCQGVTTRGTQCRLAASAGFNMCRIHGWTARYFIAFSWQERPGDHWSQKKKAHWPILFPSYDAAAKHMRSSGPVFRNLLMKRKLTCSIERTRKLFPVARLQTVGSA